MQQALSLRKRPTVTPAMLAVNRVNASKSTGPSLWALPWTPQRLGGLGTKPEYAVKSTDRFLTSPSRIRVEVKDQHKVPLLKFWVRRSPLRPLPLWAEVDDGRLDQAWVALVDEGLENAEMHLDGDAPLAAAPAGEGSEQSRNVS